MTIEKYIESYIDVTSACIEAMFGVPVSTVDSESRFIKENTFKPEQEMTINIPFSGAVSGDYFMTVNESEWSEYFNNALGDGSTEMVNSCVKELLNTILGDAITVIQEDFPDLTFLSPRIYRGSIDYPDTMTMSSTLNGEAFSKIGISLSLNMMKQDIGLKLDEAFEEIKQEKIKLLKAETTVKSIMNNIQQGIFSIDSEGIISPGCSKELSSLFKKELKDIEEKSFDKACISELINGREGDMKKWLDFIHVAPEEMGWDELVDLAPFHEEKFLCEDKESVYSFSYHKIVIDDSISVMVIIEDITEQKIAEEKLSKAKKEYESNLELLNNVISLNNSELFSFLQECDNILEDVYKLNADHEIDSDTINHLFKSIHSLKGGASTLNFNDLSDCAHRVEDYLDALRGQQKSIGAEDITEKVSSIKVELNNIYSIINRFNINKQSKEKSVQLMIDNSSLDEAISEVMNLDLNQPLCKDKRDQILNTLISMKSVPLLNCEPTIRNMVERVSTKLEKKVALAIDKEFALPHNTFHSLMNPLIHLIRNALDHGIESPDVREAQGKNSIATISLTGEIINEDYVIKVKDDGQGLQTESIKETAIKKGLIDSNNITDEQVYEIIFHPGFSTKENITDISGRGVGLDAVKASIEDLGGKVTVNNNKGKGTMFVLTIPCQTSSIGAAK